MRTRGDRRTREQGKLCLPGENICAIFGLADPPDSLRTQHADPGGDMNSIMQQYWPIFEMYQALRPQMMAILADEDLRFTSGGANPTLGALCIEMGEVEYAYIESFKQLTIDFSYRKREPGLEESVARLTAWFD